MFLKIKMFLVSAVILVAAASISLIIAKSPPNSKAIKHVEDEKGLTESGTKTVLFLGNSLTAGLGLQKSQAYPALIQQKIDSLGWPFQVVNAGLSGETSAGGLRRVDWLLKRKIDVLVLELGANDALRGLSLESTKKNLQAIIDRTTAKYPEVRVVIAGMLAPPNLGQIYTSRFNAIFAELTKENDAALVPFLLEKVAGISELNQADRIHPTAEGHKIVAQNVWHILKPVLEEFKTELH